MDMNADQIVWSSSEFKLKFLLDNPNFGLPQIVRVVQGYMADEDESLASGQVLTLHGSKKVEKILGADTYGKEVNIPINCPYKVKLVSTGEKRFFSSVADMIACENRPEVIKNSEQMIAGSGKCYAAGTHMELVDELKSEETGEVVAVVCRTPSETLHLPLDFQAPFEECLSYEILSRRYFLWEVVKEFGLPAEVQFLPVTDRNCGYGPQLGSLHIERVVSSEVVMATSVLDGVRYAITFSADLPVTIQVAKGMIDKKTTYEETRQKHQQSVDLKKFDYLSNADPYAPVIFQNEVYDTLQTPSLPRRGVKVAPYDQMPLQNQQRPCYPTKPASHTVSEPTRRTGAASLTNSVPLRRNNSEDLNRTPSRLKDMKDLENFVKEKLKMKTVKKNSKAKKKSRSEHASPATTLDSRTTDTTSRSSTSDNHPASSSRSDYSGAFVASDDGTSSTGACSISIHSSGSGGDRRDDPISLIADAMDATSLDHVVIEHRSRRSSSDSGVCLPKRRAQSTGHRRPSRAPTPIEHRRDTSSDGVVTERDNHNISDKFSEWSLPIDIRDTGGGGGGGVSEASTNGSVNFLWGVVNGSDCNNNTSSDSSGGVVNGALPNGKKTSTSTTASDLDMDTASDFKSELICVDTKTIDTASDYSPRGDNFMDTSYSSRSDTSSQNESAELRVRESAASNSVGEMRSLNEEGVSGVLASLKMTEFVELFRENQINGELLITLDVADLVTELKLSIFQAKKMLRYVHGWRPDPGTADDVVTSRRQSLNPRDWSGDDVFAHLMSINLPDFGLFCKHNQVNGELLLDILDTDTLQSLKIDHHVKISNLETKKLMNFVVKGWRPDSSPKKTASG